MTTEPNSPLHHDGDLGALSEQQPTVLPGYLTEKQNTDALIERLRDEALGYWSEEPTEDGHLTDSRWLAADALEVSEAARVAAEAKLATLEPELVASYRDWQFAIETRDDEQARADRAETALGELTAIIAAYDDGDIEVLRALDHIMAKLFDCNTPRWPAVPTEATTDETTQWCAAVLNCDLPSGHYSEAAIFADEWQPHFNKIAQIEWSDEQHPEAEPCPECGGQGLTGDNEGCADCHSTGGFIAGTDTPTPYRPLLPVAQQGITDETGGN